MTVKQELAKKAGNIKDKKAKEAEASGMEKGNTEKGGYAEETGYTGNKHAETSGTENIGTDVTGGRQPIVRLLRADEIECRVGTINEKGLSVLLFKDARVDQRILDETFTPFGWRRTHQSIDGNLYCTVEIWDESKQQWVAKRDVGSVSHSEKEKGQASDSFKRACFNWGLGRELYSAPFIWISAENVSIQKKDGRYTTSERFSVQSIAYNAQREILSLVIVNGKRQKVFEFGRRPAARGLTDIQQKALEKELERTGVLMESVLERYHLRTLEDMTAELYEKAISGLKKTKTREAA